MSALIADSTLCCARCLRAQAEPSARTVTTLASRKSHRPRQSSSTAQEVPALRVSSHRTLHPARRRSFATARQVREASTTGPAASATATAPDRRESDSDVLSTLNEQSSSAQVLEESPADALRRQLEDLRNLLLRITGNDEARSTRLVAFPSYQGGQAEEKAWMDRLSRGTARLGKQRQRNTRVAVLGDSSEDLARFSQALLEDPLSSHTSLTQGLRLRTQSSRLDGTEDSESIIHHTSSLPEAGSDSLALPSEWLHSNQIELVEVKTAGLGSPLSSKTWTSLLASDVVVVLSPPLDKADLARLARKPNVIFVSATEALMPGTLLAPAVSHTRSTAISKEAISPPLQSMIVDPTLAIQANAILSNSQPYAGGSASSTEDFTSLFLRSGIPQLREVLEGLVAGPLASNDSSQSTTLHGQYLHAQTASHLAAAFLLDISSAVAEARSSLQTAAGELGQLDLRAARDKRHSEIELGFTDLGKLDFELLLTDNPAKAEGSASSAPIEKVKAATTQHKASAKEVIDNLDTKAIEDIELLEDGQRDVARALNAKRLRWYKLPFGRADDIATDLSNALAGYFTDLERKLIFETGRLSERSLALSDLVNSFFKGPSAFGPRPKDQPSLFSATLQNQLVSLSPTTQFGFPPPAHPAPVNVRQTSLSLPITSRKVQLSSAGGPIEKLQIRAQSAAMQFYSISGGSVAAAVFLAQTPMQELAVDLPTSVGVGLLGTVLAGWRLQGAWKRSKEKFWTDWKRAQEGLSYDLQANARKALDEKIFVKADTARIVLRKQLDARQQALQQLEQTLRRSQGELSVLRNKL